ALSGHGCFASYLHSIGKLQSPACWFCGAPTDDAHHTLFVCDAWQSRRSRLVLILGHDITPQSLVHMMLQSRENWSSVSHYVVEVIKAKEAEERRRQAQPP
ncbi:Retrovirus-related Pol polyprotein from type-1 retrotransposable element R1, partial [Aphis craccivora]